MLKNKVQVTEPSGALQKINTAATKTCFRWHIFPTVDYRFGQGPYRRVSVLHQSRRYPGAADLIFLSEFTLAPGTDDSNARMIFSKV
jgi:hypothetical protein